MGPMRAAAVLFCGLLLSFAAKAITLDRYRDPVVMTGLDLPSFSGAPVDRIAAFRYQGTWIQIPVQVGQRLARLDLDADDSSGATGNSYTTTYTEVPFMPGKASTLKAGENTLAIHCKQTMGGQYIDAGLVNITQDGGRIEIEMKERMLFGSGEARLSPDALSALRSLAQTLKRIPSHLQVEGHTDNVPISTAAFPSSPFAATGNAKITSRHPDATRISTTARTRDRRTSSSTSTHAVPCL